MQERSELERQVAALEDELAKTRDEAAQAERLLGDLDGRRAELEGRLALTRQASADFEAQLDVRRRELKKAIEAEAIAAVSAATDARDEIARRAGVLVRDLLVELERLDEARTNVEARVRDAKAIARRFVEARPQPDEFAAEWRRLVDFVRDREQLRTDDELIEAAVRSPMGHEIQHLPQHLQIVARRRRAERIAAPRRRTDETVD